MKEFMDKDFLLDTDCAKKLYHEYCENMPVCDYHCHLSPKEIYENKQPEDISQLWLAGDHYKWRAMRSCGVDEAYCTGDKSGREKFENLPTPCNMQSEIRFIIGRISSLKNISESILRFRQKPQMIFMTAQTQQLHRAISGRKRLLKIQMLK